MSAEQQIAVPRWWLERVQATLQGPLPSGRIGDVAFLLREQIGDLLSRASGQGESTNQPNKNAT